MDSGRGITGGGPEYAALLAHAGGVLYGTELGSVTLKRVVFIFVFQLNTQHTEDYGWGVLVGRPFGARRRSSVRYGTRLGDLKESWFILFSN